MPDLPQPLMGGDQALVDAALHTRRRLGLPHCHEFQDVEQFPCDPDVPLVACVVEGDEDLVGEAPFMTAATRDGLLLCHHFFSVMFAALARCYVISARASYADRGARL